MVRSSKESTRAALKKSGQYSTLEVEKHGLNIVRKNISCEILKRKQLGTGDPLSSVGIMALNSISLPYKKPILK